jgi:acetyl-CoA carboxylase biotin carboxyl carrier protein
MEGPDDDGRSLLDPALLRRVLDQLEASDIDELEVADGTSRLFIRREPGAQTSPHLPTIVEPAAEGVPITAPLTGVFFSRSAPDQPAYVQAGSEVHVDDVVALIETMKLFNEVKSEVAGTVTQVLAHDEDLVETGQALMQVAPFAGDELTPV